MRTKVILLILLNFMSNLAAARVIDGANIPQRMRLRGEERYIVKLADLPVKGKATNPGWSDDYYATYKRGIAHPWQGKFKIRKEYTKLLRNKLRNINLNVEYILKLTETDINRMKMLERRKLPPSMKMDIMNGDFNYSLTRSELDRTRETSEIYQNAKKRYEIAKMKGHRIAAKRALEDMNKVNWFGLCHGWSVATVRELGAAPCVMESLSKSKVKIPFATSDTQANISLMYANYHGFSDHQIAYCGRRCNTYYKSGNKKRLKDPTYTDINPGAFHIVLANKIGINHLGFVMEVTADAPVWNQGTVFYLSLIEDITDEKITALEQDEFAIKDKEIAPKTVKQVKATTHMKYIQEIPPHIAKNGVKGIYKDAEYTYLLELDAKGQIIGGRWIGNSVTDHPDFIWDMKQVDPMNPQARKFFGGAMLKVMRVAGVRKPLDSAVCTPSSLSPQYKRIRVR